MFTEQQALDYTKDLIKSYEEGYLKGPRGYKFRTRDMLQVLFLYTNSVEQKAPDLLATNNLNTQIYDIQDIIAKIKEQVRLDIKDITFIINGSLPLARFIPKAANRKMLKDNTFDDDIDECCDDGIVFGSGFLKVWKDAQGRLKVRQTDPYFLIFNQYNFTEGAKAEIISTTPSRIIANEAYDLAARNRLKEKFQANDAKKLDEAYEIYQVVKPNLKKDGNDIYIVDTTHNIVYFTYEADHDIEYLKWDYQKRKGYPDALGVGALEKIFNILVQTKETRKRLDEVMTIASKLVMQKQVDGKTDANVGQEVVSFKTGEIIGHKGNKMEAIEIGGVKQVEMLRTQLAELLSLAARLLNVNDVLQGNTLPSGTSAALGNLLTENSSSVHKEVQKKYANFISLFYAKRGTPYCLEVFEHADDLKKYLEPNDIKLIEQTVVDYMLATQEALAAISDAPFDIATERENIKQQLKGKQFLSGAILDQLRADVQGIDTLISGEQISKAKTVSFIEKMRQEYAANPQAFKDPFNIALLLEQAQYDTDLSELQVAQLLKELQQ